MIAPGSSQLLIVDVQERLASAMASSQTLIRNCAILLTAARTLDVPVTISEQYPEGLGPTVPQLAGLTGSRPIPKLEFSCFQNPDVHAELSRRPDHEMIIAGIEAHVCVLQTALDALDSGRTVFVVADAVDARREENKERALRRAELAGCVIVSTEMVVFEWLRTAAAPEFRSISKLIR
jgi:nicotinamidase-related amidase